VVVVVVHGAAVGRTFAPPECPLWVAPSMPPGYLPHRLWLLSREDQLVRCPCGDG